MPSKSTIRAEAEAVFGQFRAAGAIPVEADILQPAEVLLDLYGEDIRARAYVTSDPLQGEMMLRPDFTVPVVQMHMAEGAEPARYTYMGEVFRKQEHLTARKSEYFQVGYEVFTRDNPEAADAEVFAQFAEILAPMGLRAATGDLGILMAAVRGLATTEKRKAALLRHIWRPRRFRALLDRFAGRSAVPAVRQAMLDRLDADSVETLIASSGQSIGLRGEAEIAARVAVLLEDREVAPLPAAEAAVLDEILALRDVSPAAVSRLRVLATDLPAIRPAVDRLAARLDALASRGIAVDSLDFEASYGRTTLEYYDGFVFGFYAEARPDLPPVATGGRYDALTAVLGQGRSIPAVGGVIRPGILAALKEGRP